MSNFWNMGSRRLCGGTYRRIFSFGAMEVTDCHSERLLNFGSMRMENCQVEKASSRGALHCHSTTFQRLHSIGCLQTTGVCQCEELRLSGSGQFAFLDCESIVLTAGSRQERAVVEGNISAKTALILLPIEIHDGFDAHTWITGAPVSFHTVACESFYGMSSICADEVNAEQVYLLAYPDTQISILVLAPTLYVKLVGMNSEDSVLIHLFKTRLRNPLFFRGYMQFSKHVTEINAITIDCHCFSILSFCSRLNLHAQVIPTQVAPLLEAVGITN